MGKISNLSEIIKLVSGRAVIPAGSKVWALIIASSFIEDAHARPFTRHENVSHTPTIPKI